MQDLTLLSEWINILHSLGKAGVLEYTEREPVHLEGPNNFPNGQSWFCGRLLDGDTCFSTLSLSSQTYCALLS